MLVIYKQKKKRRDMFPVKVMWLRHEHVKRLSLDHSGTEARGKIRARKVGWS